MKNKTIIVCGGDGFCGWPTSLKLSQAGFKVVIIDNLSRRKIDVELECDSLTPISSINKRIDKWKEITGKEIIFYDLDISKEYFQLEKIISKYSPKAIVHFAEQRAAPYSMKSAKHKRYTINNNLNSTNNILSVIADSENDIHLVHLGSAGYYGYSSAGLEIPEGYLSVKVDTEEGEKKIEIMYPPGPGSIYHLTKAQDSLSFLFYNKNDNIRITDLHQGVVWGTQTKETKMDSVLINRFDYDGDYGTVLNRFLVQSQIGHPLTVYGVGGQTRAFIHIENTVECILLAIQNEPKKNERVRVFNQSTECLQVKEIAKIVGNLTGSEIRFYKNPRREDSTNELKFSNSGLMGLGLKPITLNNGLLKEITEVVKKYKHRVDIKKVVCTSTWKKDMVIDDIGQVDPYTK